jgi:hypothetical protein
LPDGRLLFRLKHRLRDGTTLVIYEPLELLERLAALPRVDLSPLLSKLALKLLFGMG